jgi:predicted LPLAT superfamily acyltransferase
MHRLLFWIFPAVFLAVFGVWRLMLARRRRRAARLAERNPGPEGGFALIAWSLRRMPRWFNENGMRLGAWIAMQTLPWQHAASRQYLSLILGRQPTRREVWEHFYEFTRYLILRLRIAHGLVPKVCFAPGDGDDLRARIASGGAVLYGTMHLGHSDLVGFYLGHLGERVHIIRKRVGNSEDTERLAQRYANDVSFIWINDWSRLILAMNDALREGRSLAMQCDRPEYSSKREGFHFLGERRLFPFTIYHLGIMHGLPVSMSFAVPDEIDPEMTRIYMPPLFFPKPEADRRENFAAARAHFQRYLDLMEAQLRRTPFLWFNFTPINPPAPDSAMTAGAAQREREPGEATRALAPDMRPAA